jgi:hypothetical protein
VLFGSERKDIKRLEAQQMGLLRREAGYTLRDHTGNETTKVNLVSETLKAMESPCGLDSAIRDCIRQQYNTHFGEEEFNEKKSTQQYLIK